MQKQILLSYLDTYLETSKRKPYDWSKNGLQVETSKDEVKKIGYAVDASSYLIDKAIDTWVDLMITHHGLYRWFEAPLTWIVYTRVKKLIDADIGLYTSHLPLDAHPEVGNNIWLLKAFQRIYWIQWVVHPFGMVKNFETIGYRLESDYSLPFASLLTYVEQLRLAKWLYRFGTEEIKSVAISSWGGGGVLQEALSTWVDLLITWELVHHEIVWAKEQWLNLLLGWHYETEKIGIKLLCHHLSHTFEWLEVVYLDEKY